MVDVVSRAATSDVEGATPQQRAADAVRSVLTRLARERDLLLLDEVGIEAVAADVGREVHRARRTRAEDVRP